MEADPFVAPLAIRTILETLTQNSCEANRSNPSRSDQKLHKLKLR
jgi:hypothetical protein